MLPKAISKFPFLAAVIETISSGREVPTAIAVTAIIAVSIFSKAPNAITESIVKLAEK
jgi:hypothetical protein